MNVERALAAFVDGDRAAARAITGPAYRYEEMASGRRIADVDELVDRWNLVGAALGRIGFDVSRARASGDLTAATVRWSATASDKRIHVEDVVVMRWANGRVTDELHRIGALAVLESAVPASSTRRG